MDTQLRPSWPSLEQQVWERFRSHAHRKAIEARLEGYHYEGFLVGCAGIGMTVVQPHLCWGSNYKSRPGTDGPRVCGEDDMEAYATFKGCTHLVGFAVAAPPKLDDATGKNYHGCTIPCNTCRLRFAQSIKNDGVIRAATIIDLMRINERHGEIRDVFVAPSLTVGQLLELYPVPDP